MKREIIILALMLIAFSGHAQQDLPLTDKLEKAQESQLKDLYFSVMHSPGEHIYGKEYVQYYMRSHKKPLLRINEERTASLIVNGRRYAGINLQYDTFTDEVICTDNNLIFNDRIFQVSLNSDHVERFDFYFKSDTLTFRYFRKDPDPSFNLKEGFYEVVYDGKSRFLIKHLSSPYRYEAIDEYNYKPVRYVKIGESYSRITSKKQFVLLFGDKSELIRQFIHNQHVWFRKADKDQITEVLKYYEDLISGIK